jgi:phage shock protein C
MSCSGDCGYKEYMRSEYKGYRREWECERPCRVLRRSRRGIVLGVCQGFAEWLGIPAWPLRVAMIIALIATGFYPAGVAYLLAAIIMKPED